MTTTSFPVIQIEKTGKRLRNMRKENGIRVAAVWETPVIQSPVMHAQPRNGDCLKRGACDPSA